MTFLVDNTKIKNKNDINCDDMGAWEHVGSPKKHIHVKWDKRGNISHVTVMKGDDSQANKPCRFTLKRIYYRNRSSTDLRKILITIEGI